MKSYLNNYKQEFVAIYVNEAKCNARAAARILVSKHSEITSIKTVEVKWHQAWKHDKDVKVYCIKHGVKPNCKNVQRPDATSTTKNFSISIEFTDEQLIALGKKAAAKLVADFVEQINNL